MNKRLTITDVAKAVGITPRTIMRWEKSGKIKKPKRDWRGWRFYYEEDIRDIREFFESCYEFDSENGALINAAKEKATSLVFSVSIPSPFDSYSPRVIMFKLFALSQRTIIPIVIKPPHENSRSVCCFSGILPMSQYIVERSSSVFTMSVSSNVTEQNRGGGEWQEMNSIAKWSFKPQVKYRFSNNVTGGMHFEYGKNDSKRSGTTKFSEFGINVRIDIRGS